ncbi:putative secreted protein [Streptomyces sp. Tu6071]|nr:putative secreted protein [Streptomyces sp. Tu6071]
MRVRVGGPALGLGLRRLARHVDRPDGVTDKPRVRLGEVRQHLGKPLPVNGVEGGEAVERGGALIQVAGRLPQEVRLALDRQVSLRLVRQMIPFWSDDPPGGEDVPPPGVEGRDADDVAGVRRVDDQSGADVHPDVLRRGGAPLGEEEVARLKVVDRDRLAFLDLRVCRAAEMEPGGGVRLLHERGAVAPAHRVRAVRIRAGSAPLVRRAELPLGPADRGPHRDRGVLRDGVAPRDCADRNRPELRLVGDAPVARGEGASACVAVGIQDVGERGPEGEREVLPLGVGVGESRALHCLRRLGEGQRLPPVHLPQRLVEARRRVHRVPDLLDRPPPLRGTLLKEPHGIAVPVREVAQPRLLKGDREGDHLAARGDAERDTGGHDPLRVRDLLGRVGKTLDVHLGGLAAREEVLDLAGHSSRVDGGG